MKEHDFNFIIVYDISSKKFSYSDRYNHYFLNNNSDTTIELLFSESTFTSKDDYTLFTDNYNRILNSKTVSADGKRMTLRTKDGSLKLFAVVFSCTVPGKTITIAFRDLSQEAKFIDHLDYISKYDELTTLMTPKLYHKKINELYLSNSGEDLAGKYAIIFLDVIRFKAINELYGKSGGDLLLMHIADVLRSSITDGEYACRINADCFSIFIKTEGKDLSKYIENIIEELTSYEISISVNCNAGIYVITDTKISASEMQDRAILAQSTIKGSFSQKYNFFTDEIHNQMLSEHEITAQMKAALTNQEFVPYFQPQYNHSSGKLVGAEALVRWIHPEKGLISPGVFIPIFEKNGFIIPLDMYIFEKACEFLHKCIEMNINTVPISTNFSRYDIFQKDFIEQLEASRKKYNVPVELLRIEITESAVFGGSEMTNNVVHKLHECGYIVEMDDFGSGYSSLNILKDVDFDIIKLDMKFLSDKDSNKRGGTVINSIVNMAKWLSLPVIAEGVETVSQADFLTSIGANFIQGYLYSKPLPEAEFINKLKEPSVHKTIQEVRINENLNYGNFWDPKSLDTIIFNNFVGGACIFNYNKADDTVEMLRLNQKYLKELGMNLTEKDILNSDITKFFDEENLELYKKTLNKAIESKDEEECETWRTFSNKCCGEEKLCIRSNIRFIGSNGNVFLFYSSIRNVTVERKHIMDILDSERRFKAASEQANIYYWEYDVATKDMHPCFRCMRDLGLPAVVHNYPEPVIENGLFPADYAELYRQWHKNIADGVKEQEAVIPLTVGRIPFRVKYTTEFDAVGKPVKAYGSATLIIENKE